MAGTAGGRTDVPMAGEANKGKNSPGMADDLKTNEGYLKTVFLCIFFFFISSPSSVLFTTHSLSLSPFHSALGGGEARWGRLDPLLPNCTVPTGSVSPSVAVLL